ncbi:pyrimidine 5'-nucleotidase [Cunninghamella echinulata]|nr:pyrimidine 5'-nucleotidase [Cunninghamella echinulata]
MEPIAQNLVQKLLQIPTIRIKNQIATAEKLSKIIQGGRSNLHFICDFDMTISKHWVRNKVTDALERNASSHGVPARYDKLSPEFKKETARLYNTYYPIEIDKTMTFEEKVPSMIQWWMKAHEAMVKQNLTRQDIVNMVEQVNIELRAEVDKVLQKCRDLEIPFLVFSAGIGNIIEQILLKRQLYYDNMHIVSNMMVFNKDDICTGFNDPLIHVFNKSEFQLESTPYYSLIQHRTNVILVGDSLGDLQMSQGIQHDLCLNIGFLNHDIEFLEPRYLQAFDIVIEGDANMIPILEILKHI